MVSYSERLRSVKPLEDPEVEAVEQYRKREKMFLKNKDVVDEIKEVLKEKSMNQKELVKIVNENSGFGKNRIFDVLKQHTGLNISSFQFWDIEKSGIKNERIYTLNDRK